jgi:hypothetical protein
MPESTLTPAPVSSVIFPEARKDAMRWTAAAGETLLVGEDDERTWGMVGTVTLIRAKMNVPAALQTPGFAHYAVAWSPFHNTRIALASAANFGLVGNGRLNLLTIVPGPGGASGINLDK